MLQVPLGMPDRGRKTSNETCCQTPHFALRHRFLLYNNILWAAFICRHKNTNTCTRTYTFQTCSREQHYLSNLADNHSFYHLRGFPAVTHFFFSPSSAPYHFTFFLLGLPPSLHSPSTTSFV